MVRQYIGARYTIKVYENSLNPASADWEPSTSYEPLTLVTFNNSSYLSKKSVPASIGDPANNPSYWVVTGAYNGQIAYLQSQIDAINELYVTPEQFGAVGDGVTDDYTAIADAISNSNGRPVLFQNKTYASGSEIVLPSNITLIGNNTTLKLLDPDNVHNFISAKNETNIKISGINIDNNANLMTTTTTGVWQSAIVFLCLCNNCVLENLVVHGTRMGQSAIIIQGDNNEVVGCEVYTGSGNRQNSGIVTGSHHYPAMSTDGGSRFTKIHGCYVHDISTGTSQDESGYGIYLMATEYSEVYDNLVIDCNWVCINTQSEIGLGNCKHNAIHDNTTIIDNVDVYPRQDYLGPYNIYMESTEDSDIYDNVMVCGACTSSRYIPLNISEGGNIIRAHGNRFVLGSTNNVFALVSSSSELLYENNITEFTPDVYILCYNDPEFKFKASNCNLLSTTCVVKLARGTQPNISGYIDISNCTMTGTKFADNSADDIVTTTIINSEFSGTEFLADYFAGDTTIDNCKITVTGQTPILFFHGSGTKTIKNCHIIGGEMVIRVRPATTPFNAIIVKDNYIETTHANARAVFWQAADGSRIIVDGNYIKTISTTDHALWIFTNNITLGLCIVSNNILEAACDPVYFTANGDITRGFVTDNIVVGNGTVGVTASATVVVQNNNCLA